MKINGLGLTKQLESDIDTNLTELKNAIWKHQTWIAKRKQDPYNFDLQKEVKRAEEEIVFIGVTQKSLLAKLREEYKSYQKTLKCNLIKNGIEEKRFNLTNALNRARKQNMSVTESIHKVESRTVTTTTTTTSSFSDDSPEALSDAAEAATTPLPASPVVVVATPAPPLRPWDLTQEQFLGRLGLVTHDVYKEMQNRRVERKRRSTANPHFLYGSRGCDFLSHGKRKRNAFLLSPPSPPHTRQAVRRRQERAMASSSTSPPPPVLQEQESGKRGLLSSFPSIPNLPSGLIIERVGPGETSASPDSKTCVACKQPGALSVCDVCMNGFHVGCHNRPLTHAPHQCPRCIQQETRTVGSLNVPSGMSVSYVTAELAEKLSEKRELEEKNRSLLAGLSELESRRSQLSISISDETAKQKELMTTKRGTEGKIQQILTFIESMQRRKVEDGEEP